MDKFQFIGAVGGFSVLFFIVGTLLTRKFVATTKVGIKRKFATLPADAEMFFTWLNIGLYVSVGLLVTLVAAVCYGARDPILIASLTQVLFMTRLIIGSPWISGMRDVSRNTRDILLYSGLGRTAADECLSLSMLAAVAFSVAAVTLGLEAASAIVNTLISLSQPF